MVYQAEGNKFAWAPAVDNLLKAVRGTGIIDFNGFKVENSYSSDLAVKITNGGAAEIQGTSVYWSDLNFSLDNSYIINDNYQVSTNGYSLDTSASSVGLKQNLEPMGGWITEIRFYANVTGTVGHDLRVEIYNETDSSQEAYVDVSESSLSSSYTEVTWTLSNPINLDPDKSYSIRFYRNDNSGPTDYTNVDSSNYYSIGYGINGYSYGEFQYYNGASWVDETYQMSFKITRYDYKWVAQTRSTISLESGTVDSTPYSLKWVYNDDGATQYSNRITRYLAPNKQDWSKRNKIRFKFYASSSLEDKIYVGLKNSGTEYAIGTIETTDITSGTWNVVEFDLPTYKDQVEELFWYVDGNNWSTGDHTFYIDSIVVYKKITFTAPSTSGYGRIDLIYLDDTGAVNVKTGTEVDLSSDTPMPQDLDLDEIGLALVSVQNGDTSFTSDDIVDIRTTLNEE